MAPAATRWLSGRLAKTAPSSSTNSSTRDTTTKVDSPETIPTDALQSSVDDFFAHLSPDDQILFKATTLSIQLLQDIQDADARHKERSSSRRAATAIKPFIAGVEHYSKAWDVIANTGFFLSPIWGSTRVLLRIASEFGDYFDNLSSMFSQIGRQLLGIRRYPVLYPDNALLQASMVDIFKAMFDFLTKAAAVFRVGQQRSQGIRSIGSVGFSAAIKIIWKPFKVQFGDVIDRISRCVEDIEAEVEIAEKELAHEERQRAQKERELAQKERAVQARDRFHRAANFALVGKATTAWMEFVDEKSAEKMNVWLAPANVASNHNAATKARHADSGSWFLEGSPFQQWLSQDNSFLWLHAIPGAGKTVLASTIINHLKDHVQSAQVGLAYFYCDYRESQKQQPLKVLSSLLSMLSIQNRKIFLEAQTFFQEQYKQNPAYTIEFDGLLSNFETFVRGSFEHILIVVDALDECNDRDCLAEALKHIHQSCSNVKVLVTSRNEIDIARAFSGFDQSSIEQDDVAFDIERYAKAELALRIQAKKLKLRDAKLADVIAQSIVEGAKGMFQWAKCQIEHLCTLRNDKAIRSALKDLPKTLHDSYIRILERIQEQNEDDILNVQRVLRWLVKGVRNMSLDELAECISIDPEGDETHMEFDAVLTDPEDILELCGSLVSVTAERYVSIAHYSAKEFLVSDNLKKRMPDFWVGNHEVESELATVCLKYLTYDDFADCALSCQEEVSEKLEEYKALKYISTAWPIHAYRSRIDGLQTESVVNLTMQLLNTQGGHCHNFELWKQMFYFKSGSRTSIARGSFRPLYCASYFGLTEAVEQLLSIGIPENCSEPLKVAAGEGHMDVVKSFLRIVPACSRPNMQTAFYAAAARGHVEIVKLLLDEGIEDINNTRAGKDGTALQAAALEGRHEVVSFLLAHGANAGIPCKRWGTPLAAAAEKGHLKTLEILLDHGANPNGRGGWYCYPLVSAVVGKNTAIIDLLLERGADVNAQGGRHTCALMAAAAIGMRDLVTKLVANGAKVNDEDDKGSDALYAACTAGHLEIVNLLLELGADVNAKGGKHRNALNAASAEGKIDIVKRLIEAGADVDLFDEHHGTALQLAAYKGHEAIVRCLVDAGADADAEGGDRGCALFAAAQGGHVAVIQTLFELGVSQGATQDMTNALVIAAEKGHTKIVEALVDAGADLDSLSTMRNPAPSTPLEMASSYGHDDIVEFLIEKGADVNLVNEGSAIGFPLLGAVTSTPHEGIVARLLDAGADPNLVVSSDTYATYGYALSAAVATKDLSIVKLLIGRGADVNLVHENYPTPMQLAAGFEDMEILEHLVSCEGDVNLVIGEATYQRTFVEPPVTPLQQAAFYGLEDNVRKLVSLGASFSVDESHPTFKNALQVASHEGHLSVVRALIELGCDVNEIGGTYGTSVIAASRTDQTEVIRALLDAGADPNIGDVGAWNENALCTAAWEGHTDTVRLLLERGADPNKPGGGAYQYGLHAAAAVDQIDTLKVLIELGANVNATGGRYMTALHIACANGCDASFVLLENGADPNIVGGEYGTALTAAYTGGFYIIINSLYQHGADNALLGGNYGSPMGAALGGSCQGLINFMVHHRNFDLNTTYGRYGNALQHTIAVDREDEILELFLRNGSDVNKRGGYFGSALTAAAWQESLDWVNALLDAGADVNLEGNARYPNALYGAIDSKPDSGWAGKFDVFERLLLKGCDIHGGPNIYGTPIQRAANRGRLSMVRRLIKRGADPDAFPSSKFGSALQAAASADDRVMVRYLVNRGSNVNLKGGLLGNPLNAAVRYSSPSTVELLLQRGADPNQRGGLYGFALQAAAVTGKSEVLLLLLRYGAEVNAVGGRYGTALQAAVVSGNDIAVKLLIERGADIGIEAGKYRTALNAAAIRGDEEIARTLIEAGAVIDPLDRHRLAHITEALLDSADELLEKIHEDPDWAEVDAEDADENEDDEDVENEEGESQSDDEDEDIDAGEEPEYEPLPLNVLAIPGFDEPYNPPPPPAVTMEISKTETQIVTETVEVEVSAAELCSVFSFDIIEAY